MAYTLAAVVQVPAVFERYLIERTAELSAFGQSGIVQEDPALAVLAGGGGNTVNMPFWQDLTASRQIMNADGTTPLTVNGIASAVDIARIQNDAQVFGANLLAGWLAGSDPMEAIVSGIAAYWARVDELTIIKSLEGVFGAASMATNLLNIAAEADGAKSVATTLNGMTFIDACQKLGDRADRLTAIAMHSATESALRKQDLIDFIPGSEGKPVIRTFQGRRVVVDDTLPTRAGNVDGTVYRTYLFGPGAFGRGSAGLTNPVEGGQGTQGVEFGRDSLNSNSHLVNRRRYILHPRGVKFNSTNVAGSSPTDAELATAANWTRVYEAKNVRIVAIDHNN